ncbi:MAG: DNA cytosine methyltransferase [Candidatus Heimdallarchaeaceae archaeon]
MINEPNDAPTVIDLFCGIGGATLGFIQAGYEVKMGVDVDSTACRIYTVNTGVQTKNTDIREYDTKECLQDVELQKGEIDVVICCPPCQGFSRIRRNGEKDLRNDLVLYTGYFVTELQPKVVIFENVKGIMSKKYKNKFIEFCTILEDRGYFINYDILDMANFGLPQRRERVILFAVHKNIRNHTIPLPTKTHENPIKIKENENLKPWKTVRDAIFSLPRLESGEKCVEDLYHASTNHMKKTIEKFKLIPTDGGTRLSLPKKYWLKCHLNHKGHNDVYSRMFWDKPAPTLTGGCLTPSKGRFIHPEDHRGLTIREACRIQTIPDNFSFLDANKDEVGKYIGNSVPVEFMKLIALHIAKEMGWEKRLSPQKT